MTLLAIFGVSAAIALFPLVIMGAGKAPNLPSSSHIGREPLYDKEK